MMARVVLGFCRVISFGRNKQSSVATHARCNQNNRGQNEKSGLVHGLIVVSYKSANKMIGIISPPSSFAAWST
jgi:hypothetical protein